LKYLVLIIFLATSVNFAVFAQSTLKAKDAHEHINEYITLCDTVYGTKYIDHNLRLLFLGAPYPHQLLTVIQRTKTNISLTGYKVCVNGFIKLKRGKPTIYIRGKILLIGPLDL
jgi:hypothetical protein